MESFFLFAYKGQIPGVGLQVRQSKHKSIMMDPLYSGQAAPRNCQPENSNAPWFTGGEDKESKYSTRKGTKWGLSIYIHYRGRSQESDRIS